MSIKNNTTSLQELLEAVNNLPNAGSGGVDLPELTNEGTESDLMLGKELIDGDGRVVIGSFTIDSELTAQDDLIAQIQAVVDGLPEAGGEAPVLQSKTVTPDKSVQVITPDGGYDGLNAVTVNAIPNEYIIPEGILNITENGTHNVTAVAQVSVSVANSGGGSGEGSEALQSFINGTITNFNNNELSKAKTGLFAECTKLSTVNIPACTEVGTYAFYNCTSLTSVSLPACTKANNNAFANCTSLANLNLPACSSFGTYVLSNCKNLEMVNLPELSYIGAYAFSDCNKLETLNLPKGNNIGGGAFSKCFNLKEMYLTSTAICRLQNSNAFTSTPIGGYSTSAGTYGSIYVPASMIDTYKTSTNWTYFSSRFVGV